MPLYLAPSNHQSVLYFWIYLFWIFHINDIIQYVTFCIRLLSLSIFLRLMLYHVSVLHSFMANLLYVYTTFCLAVHLLMDIWVVSTFWLLRITLLWNSCTSIYWNTCFQIFWISRCRIAGSCANAVFNFWGTSRLFSTMAASFHVPTSIVQGFQFFHILASTWYLTLFGYNHPSGYEVVSHCRFDFNLPNE